MDTDEIRFELLISDFVGPLYLHFYVIFDHVSPTNKACFDFVDSFQHFLSAFTPFCLIFPHIMIICDNTCRPLRACRPRQRRRAASSW